MRDPDLTVIVPVYNHWHFVPALIEALRSQELSTDQFELILIDNGSDNIPTELELPMWSKLLECHTSGSYAARNVGINASRGQLIAFTDADCVPTPQWLTEILRCWSGTNGMSLVAGGLRVEPTNWAAMTISEMYDIALGLPQQRYVSNGYAVTANLLIPKQAFENLGLFDPQRFSGGDADFCRRAVAQGWGLIYCEQAEVVHPARRNIEELLTKQRRVVGGQLRAGPLRNRLKYGIAYVFPPLREWVIALRTKRLSLIKRLQVCGIISFVKFVAFLEMIRLFLGGKPERR